MTTAIKNPIGGGLFGDLKEGFTGFARNFYDAASRDKAESSAIVTRENPELTGMPHYQEREDIFYKTFGDWALENPLVFKDLIKGYFAEYGRVIGFAERYCDYELTNQEIFTMSTIEYGRQMPENTTRKTVPRMISSTVTKKDGRAQFKHAGFQECLYGLRNSDGRDQWDLKLRAVAGDFVADITWVFINQLLASPQYAREPEQLWPNASKPTSVDEVFRRDQERFGIFNKSTGAMSHLLRDANVIFNQFGGSYKTTEVWMSRSDTFYMYHCNDINVRVDKGGNGVIATREALDIPSRIGDVAVTSIPFIEANMHNTTDELLLVMPTCNGSQAVFVDMTHNLDACHYKTWMRTIEYVSLKTDTWDRYPLRDFLHACPEYHPVLRARRTGGASSGTENEADVKWRKSGQLDVDALERLANEGRGDHNIFARAGTRRTGNERVLHPFLRAVDYEKAPFATTLTATSKSKAHRASFDQYAWEPCVLFGQLPEQSAKTQYMEKMYETMARHLYGGLSEEEMTAWSDGVARFVSDAEGTTKGLPANVDAQVANAAFVTAAEKIVKRLNLGTYGHPFFGNLHNIATKDASFAEITSTATGSPFARKIVDILNYITMHRATYSFYDWDTARAHGLSLVRNNGKKLDDMLSDARGARIKDEDVKKTDWPWWAKAIHRTSLFAPGISDDEKVSPFMYRFHKSFEYTPELMFAAQVCIWQPNCLQAIDRFAECDIMIPVGGRNLRMRERQLTHTMLFMAFGNGLPKLGKFFHSGYDDIISFNADTKDFFIERGHRFGFIILNNKQYIIMPHVRGGAYLGGSDDKYVDQRVLSSANVDYAEFFRNMQTEASNLAVLGSWNEAIEGKYRLSISAKGYYDRREFVTRLHESEDFTRERVDPMFSGVFALQQRLKFAQWENLNDYNNLDKLNYFDLARIRDENFICHQTSVRMYDPVTDTFVVTRSTHPWGDHAPGMRAKVTSGANVTDYEDTGPAEQMRKKTRFNF
jgi:hypothetical protein